MGAGPWSDRLLDIALSPALWLSVALALIYAALFTVWRGGGRRQFPRDLLAGLIGFGVGQAAGVLSGLDLLRVGDVQLLWGTAGAVGALWLGRRFRSRASSH